MDESSTQLAQTRHQDAFRRLVEQHINLVYAAARRQLRDATTAQDVTQAVFILLSQKASHLTDAPLLTGWLLRTTYFICKDVRKRENRRRFHEAQAALMRQHQAILEDEETDALKAVLDSAMVRLTAADRSAIALRFLENRPLKQVGQLLGISEEAARKRVDRAISHLRQAISAQGVTAPAVLGTALTAKAIEIAPAAITAAVLAPATTGAAAMASAGAKLFLWMQIKVAATAAAAIILFGTVALAIEAVAFHAPAPVPIVSLPAPATTMPSAALPKPGEPVLYRGQLVDPNGQPVPNAAIQVYLTEHPKIQTEWQGKTGADGSFTVGPLPGETDTTQRTILFDAPGKALAWWNAGWDGPLKDISSIKVDIQPSTRVAGTVTDTTGKPIANALVEAEINLEPSSGPFDLNVDTKLSVITDAAGTFHWDRIPQGARLDLTVHHPDFCTWSSYIISNGYSPVAAGNYTDIGIQLIGNPATLHAQLTKDRTPMAESGRWLLAANAAKADQYQQTDAQGRADFRGLAPGIWQVRNPYSTTALDSIVIPQFDISLEAGQERDVSLVCGGTPILGQEFEPGTTHPSHQPIIIYLVAGDHGLRSVTPDAQGRFGACCRRGAYGLHSLSWDSWEKDGYRNITQDFTIPVSAPDVAVTIFAREAPTLHGQLVDGQGNAISGFVLLENHQFAYAGPDGRFSLGKLGRPLFAGEQLLGVAFNLNRTLARGFVADRPAPDSADLRLVLEPMATIVGAAVDRAGHPLPETKVAPSIVSDHNAMPSTNGWISKTTINETGAFRTTSVPVGYRLALLLELEGMQADIPIVDLAPGETRDVGQVVLHRPGGATRPADPGRNIPPREPWDAIITGRLLDQASNPLVGCLIEANANVPGRDIPENLEAEGISDLKGRFTISGLPRGRNIQLQINLHGQPYSWNVIPGFNAVDPPAHLGQRTARRGREPVCHSRSAFHDIASLPDFRL